MTSIDTVCQTLAQIAPLRLAESWDNVGLLVGSRSAEIDSVMTCLTVTPAVVEEAVKANVGMVVVHHPLPFKPLARITSDTITGQMLLKLIAAGIAVYSAHTAFDSAVEGINQQWAETLQLADVQPLVPLPERSPTDSSPSEGAGRLGKLPQPVTLGELAKRAAAAFGSTIPRLTGNIDAETSKVAIACGSGGSFLAAARRRGCDALITGEANFHTCLEAESSRIGLVLLGHYWSERFAMERLAEQLQREFVEVSVWASRIERDPIVPLPR